MTFKIINSPERASSKICHCVILLNVYLTIKNTDFIRSMFYVPNSTILPCLLQIECSVYYPETNHKHLKSQFSFYFFHVFVLINQTGVIWIQKCVKIYSLLHSVRRNNINKRTYKRSCRYSIVNFCNTRKFVANIYSKTSILKVQFKPIY